MGGKKGSKKRSRNNAPNNSNSENIQGLTAIAKFIFGDEVIDEVIRRKFTVRDIWEFSTPTTQCNNVIDPHVIDKTECWICGLAITKHIGMTAECEHILPIAQAAMYLKLYNDSLKAVAKDDKWINSEYGWAHRVCNQEKNDMCALVQKGHIFEVDNTELRRLLKNIYDSTRVDSNPIKVSLRKHFTKVNNFIDSRIQYITDRYNNIINTITHATVIDNHMVVTQEDRSLSAKLITLAGYSALSDLSIIRPELHDLLNPVAVAQVIREAREKLDVQSRAYMTGTPLDILTNNIDLYDDIQTRVVDKLHGYIKYIPILPKYREYFARRGIDPRSPVKSLNPENYQSEMFKFIGEIYPKLFQNKKNKETVIDIISDFVCFNMLKDTFKSHPSNVGDDPRLFLKSLNERLDTVPEIFTYLGNEYRAHIKLEEGARALFNFRNINANNAADALTAMRSAKTRRLNRNNNNSL
jgi:hypothetical protein